MYRKVKMSTFPRRCYASTLISRRVFCFCLTLNYSWRIAFYNYDMGYFCVFLISNARILACCIVYFYDVPSECND